MKYDTFMEISKDQFDRYIERRKIDVLTCRNCLIQRDFQKIAEFGHKLFGNGTTFGIPELTSLGAKLEKSAIQKDLSEINKHLNSISQIINSLH